jgi:hypothetical protein
MLPSAEMDQNLHVALTRIRIALLQLECVPPSQKYPRA